MVVGSLPQTSDIGLMLLNVVFFCSVTIECGKGNRHRDELISAERVLAFYIWGLIKKFVLQIFMEFVCSNDFLSMHNQLPRQKNAEHLFNLIFLLDIQIYTLKIV